MKKKYRVRKDYSDYVVEEYVPEKRFLWIFVVQQEDWKALDSYRLEQDAMTGLRRAQKYGHTDVIYQDDVDELDLGTALE